MKNFAIKMRTWTTKSLLLGLVGSMVLAITPLQPGQAFFFPAPPPPRGGGGGGGSVPPPAPTPTPPPPKTQQPAPEMPSTPSAFNGPVPTDTLRLNALLQIPEVLLDLQPDGYQLACETCRGIKQKDREAVLFPVRDSLYSLPSASNVKLVHGRMLVISAKDSVRVETTSTSVLVPSFAAAVVDVAANGLTHVYGLTSGKNPEDSTTVSLKSGCQPTVVLQSGQDLIAAEHNIADEELIPTDGIAHRVIEGKITLPSTARLGEFSLDQLYKHNLLIACRPMEVRPSTRAGQLFQDVHQQVQQLAKSQNSFDLPSGQVAQAKPQSAPTHDNVLVSTVSTVSSAANRETLVNEGNQVVIAQKGSVYHVQSSNDIQLESGSLLVRSERPVVITAQERSVRISKGAVALVKSFGGSLKVVNMSDLARDSVKVIHNEQETSLRNGEELILSSRAPSLTDVYDLHQVGHKSIESKDLGDLGWQTTSQVYIPQLLKHHPLCKSAPDEAGNSGLKKAMDQVLRTAAILNMLGRDPASFQQGLPEDEEKAEAVLSARISNPTM